MRHAGAERGTREPPVGHQDHVAAEPRALDRGGDREHLAHARAAAGPLVPDDQDVALVDPPRGDRGEAVLLALEDPRPPVEPQRLDARRLYYRAARHDTSPPHPP